MKLERIQSEGAGLCADGEQTLHRVEGDGGGLERKSMTERLQRGAKREISTAITCFAQCE
jgi:hypothetical protein